MKYPTYLVLIFGLLSAQESDTSGVGTVDSEEPAFSTSTSLFTDYSKSTGNTSADIFYFGLSFDLRGDVGPLKDMEFFFGYNRSNSKVDADPLEDDENIISTIDLWANQYFASPFLIFQNQKDAILNLKNRRNFGLGVKVSLPLGLSLSYALLPEEEIYDWEFISDSVFTIDQGLYDEYAEYYGEENFEYYEIDSTYYGAFVNIYSTFDSTRNITRHSIRPKIKLKLFEGNIVFDYRFYYKPNISDFEDYLLVNELKISIATFYEALSLSINYNDSFNSQYDYKDSPIKSKDSDISIGLSFDL